MTRSGCLADLPTDPFQGLERPRPGKQTVDLRWGSNVKPPYRVWRANSPRIVCLSAALQLNQVAWLIPALAADIATAALSLPCFRMNAFCASVNFDAFIVFRSSPSREMLAENSSFKRSGFQGAQQKGCALQTSLSGGKRKSPDKPRRFFAVFTVAAIAITDRNSVAEVVGAFSGLKNWPCC